MSILLNKNNNKVLPAAVAVVNKPKKIKSETKINSCIKEFFRGISDMGRSHNSCGIKELDDVSDAYEDVLIDSDSFDDGNDKDSYLSPEEYKRFKTKLMEQFSVLLKKEFKFNARKSFGFYNISLNNHANKDLIEILDKNASFQTDWRVNPNSGNKIKVWLF